MYTELDPYEVLGINPGATGREIKKRYRLLSKTFHPDVNPGDSKAEETFKLIQWAYDSITNGSGQGQCEKRTSVKQPGPGHFVDPDHPFMSFFEVLKSYSSKRDYKKSKEQG
jgi:molecular chaperone DnaJ